MIFVNSMSDLFHPAVPAEFVVSVFETMERADWHIFQVLTKRPERAIELSSALPWPSNVWVGVSVENRRFLHRLDALRSIPALLRFASCEPLLGPLSGIDLTNIDWVIAGRESGPRARRMKPTWAHALRDECVAQDIPFFFKQWGAHDQHGRRVGKHRAGRLLDGRLWEGMPLSTWGERT